MAGLCILSVPEVSYSQEKINLSDLIDELVQQSPSANTLTQVWWIPNQFWQASFSQNSTMSQEEINQFLEVMRPYTLIAVVDARLGPLGGPNFTSEMIVRSRVIIQDSEGKTYRPIEESILNPDIKNLLAFIKPVLINIMGPMGENTHFLIFNSRTQDGQPIADATKEGFFIVNALGEEFKYKLPLGSVLPPKYDPETGEKFPGNYNYNPFTGSRLDTK
ncbi:MAG: hypothetical protein AB4057_19525 [Crocosphaera sp.]